MRPLFGHSETVSEFVRQFGDAYAFRNCTAIGVIDNEDRLVAGVVYSNWMPGRGTIEVSAASTTPHWMNKTILKVITAYPFDQLDCQLVYMRTSEKNTRLHQTLKRFGCDAYAIPRLRGPDEAEIIFTLTRETYHGRR